MKRLLTGIFAALLSAAAFGTTFTPIQLLNPTGSVAGQVIVSSGPTTVAAWGGIGVNGITALAANTVLANATGSSASPTAFAMPSCSSTVSALNWTTSTGFVCNTGLITAATVASTYAPLASPTFTGTPAAPTATTGTSTTQLATTAFVTAQPTINQPNIVASTTGTAAASGSVGFYQTANTAAASATGGTPLNVASISLSPGVWDVQCSAQFVPAGTTVQQNAEIGVSTTSATFGAYPTITESGGVTSAGFGQVFSSPRVPLNITTTTTVFCVAQANFTVSTMQIAGTIGAWLRH